ncbi:unnamed protein product [Nesidiocoris tenuis]|uniref:Uncharacterized protein n=1 Tax=Nesidiocoris tenuis TaxID=355587 RepID=A0A6H5GH02_9HEMI|nr:unnamed protein product [Nesidiocoris tenuis]
MQPLPLQNVPRVPNDSILREQCHYPQSGGYNSGRPAWNVYVLQRDSTPSPAAEGLTMTPKLVLISSTLGTQGPKFGHDEEQRIHGEVLLSRSILEAKRRHAGFRRPDRIFYAFHGRLIRRSQVTDRRNRRRRLLEENNYGSWICWMSEIWIWKRNRSCQISDDHTQQEYRRRSGETSYLHFVKTATVPMAPYVTTLNFHNISNVHVQVRNWRHEVSPLCRRNND